MAIDFPASPTVGQEYTSGGMTYVYNGTGWTIKGGSTTALATNAYVDAQDALKVAKAGDTMSGNLTLSKANPFVFMNNLFTTGNASAVRFMTNNKYRWDLYTGNDELGNDSGSDFVITAYNDAGAGTSTPLQIIRKTGQVLFNGVPAALLDAMSYNGIQVNGGMEVNQELGVNNYAVLANGVNKYACDGWQAIYINATAGLIRLRQIGGSGFDGSAHANGVLEFSNSAAMTAAAGDVASIYQNIEGYRCSRLGWGLASAQPITISFWVYAMITGHFGVAVRNGPANRSYVADVTINAAATWEYKTITIPGDTTGTWSKDNTIGIVVTFNFMCGTNFRTAPGVWTAGNFVSVTGAANFFASSNQMLYISNVTVIPGTQAPTKIQSSLIMRPYDQELVTCQRYWEKLLTLTNTTGDSSPIPWTVTKRATPTLTIAFQSGTGATYFNLPNIPAGSTDGGSIYQSAAHSAKVGAAIMGDARL